MGLTIYYKGKFNPSASLSEMIEEVKDIAEIYKWKYHVFETEFPKGTFGKRNFNEEIYGISFSPPESEAVWLCFLSNGVLANPFMFQYWQKSKDKKAKKRWRIIWRDCSIIFNQDKRNDQFRIINQ